MELVTFKLIIDIGLGLCNLAKGLFSSDRKKNLGAWMVELGSLIEEVADELEAGKYPYTTCAKMDYMVMHFREVVGDTLDDELDDLERKLHQARNIERLFGEMQSLDDRERTKHVIELKETAGHLLGAGEILQKGL